MSAILQALGLFMSSHPELVSAVMQAIESGASKEELLRVIRATMVTTSDETMRDALRDLP